VRTDKSLISDCSTAVIDMNQN